MTSAARVGARCASHPARPAVDSCPICARDRCAADASGYAASGCRVCRAEGAGSGTRPLTEQAVRAGLAALAAALAGGWIVVEYVNVRYMSLIAPGVLGLGVSWAASAAAGTRDRRGGWVVLGVASAAAVLGTALGFRLFGRPVTPVHPLRQVWLPYVAAVVGIAGWPLLFGGPGSRRDGAHT
jgi:hypothetical protein